MENLPVTPCSAIRAQKSIAESRLVARAETFHFCKPRFARVHRMGRLNGQTSSSLTGRTSGLPL